MRHILITDFDPAFLIKGLNLHDSNHNGYSGKLGRHEVLLGSHDIESLEGEFQIIKLGLAEAGTQFRAGDILMTGSDELLDRAFLALDEMEQRGLVVSLTPSGDPKQLHLADEKLFKQVSAWKTRKIPFLSLMMVGPIEPEGQAKLVSLVRKVIN